jgi:hypothetical protein
MTETSSVMAIEGLEDFNTLLLTDREVLDDRIGVDFEAIVAGQRLELGARLGERGGKQGRILCAEHHVFEDGEIIDQHEVLVDHADTERQGLTGIGDGRGRAVDADFAAVGSVEAVEDRHQGRFAGAVFAHDAMHRAAPDGEVDVTIGVDGAEMLVDADKLDSERGSSGPFGPLRICRVKTCHWRSPPLLRSFRETGTPCRCGNRARSQRPR